MLDDFSAAAETMLLQFASQMTPVDRNNALKSSQRRGSCATAF
jgi:hypothetical protein